MDALDNWLVQQTLNLPHESGLWVRAPPHPPQILTDHRRVSDGCVGTRRAKVQRVLTPPLLGALSVQLRPHPPKTLRDLDS